MGARFLGLTGFNIKAVEGEEECNLGEGWFGMNGIVFGLVVGTIVMPLLTIPLTWIFIPHIRLCDDFIADVDQARETELTTGALSGPGASFAEDGNAPMPERGSKSNASLGAWSFQTGP